jgi:hypothetical protein
VLTGRGNGDIRRESGGTTVEQIVVKGILESRTADFGARYEGHGYALVDETTGEVLYGLEDPKKLLDQRIGDLIEVHGTVAQTEGEIPLLEVIRVD